MSNVDPTTGVASGFGTFMYRQIADSVSLAWYDQIEDQHRAPLMWARRYGPEQVLTMDVDENINNLFTVGRTKGFAWETLVAVDDNHVVMGQHVSDNESWHGVNVVNGQNVFRGNIGTFKVLRLNANREIDDISMASSWYNPYAMVRRASIAPFGPNGFIAVVTGATDYDGAMAVAQTGQWPSTRAFVFQRFPTLGPPYTDYTPLGTFLVNQTVTHGSYPGATGSAPGYGSGWGAHCAMALSNGRVLLAYKEDYDQTINACVISPQVQTIAVPGLGTVEYVSGLTVHGSTLIASNAWMPNGAYRRSLDGQVLSGDRAVIRFYSGSSPFVTYAALKVTGDVVSRTDLIPPTGTWGYASNDRGDEVSMVIGGRYAYVSPVADTFGWNGIRPPGNYDPPGAAESESSFGQVIVLMGLSSSGLLEPQVLPLRVPAEVVGNPLQRHPLDPTYISTQQLNQVCAVSDTEFMRFSRNVLEGGTGRGAGSDGRNSHLLVLDRWVVKDDAAWYVPGSTNIFGYDAHNDSHPLSVVKAGDAVVCVAGLDGVQSMVGSGSTYGAVDHPGVARVFWLGGSG